MSDIRPDRRVRAVDNNEVLLDNDGEPITELIVASADALAEAEINVAEIASRQRSWRYGHVIVDEAQDLTPMQWRMVARRARGGAMTIVGDLAQRSIGEPGRWPDHLPPSLGDFAYQELTINYRSPAEINRVAAHVLTALAPELNAPESIRSSGHEPIAVPVADLSDGLEDLVRATRAEVPEGRLAVIGATEDEQTNIDGVQWISPWQSKGLEFDTVILVEPSRIMAQEHGLSLLFVALTRTTDRLIIAHQEPLPDVLAAAIS